MIELSSIIHWRQNAPWGNDAQVEQDLIISRTLVDIFNHPLLAKTLTFRGGTALQKCFHKKSTRYSEDIDLVQRVAGPIGPILDGFRDSLEPWLGKPRKKLGQGRATLYYPFETTTTPITKAKLKVEINTREHFSVFDLVNIPFQIKSPWYSGQTEIISYPIEELLGTKLRALYQRKKGRDLYDLAIALEEHSIRVEKVIECFLRYMEWMELKVSRAEFEENLLQKRNTNAFRHDMIPLISPGKHYDFEKSFKLVWDTIITQLPGEPWKKTEEQL